MSSMATALDADPTRRLPWDPLAHDRVRCMSWRHDMTHGEQQKFLEVLERFSAVVLVTYGDDGLDARPMALVRVEPDCDVWLMTMTNTGKVQEIKAQSRVQLVAQHNQDTFISLSGTADLISDPGKVRELWKEPYRVWFPDGPDDPDILLIRIRADAGEFWDNAGANKAKYLLQAAKAYASGERPDIEEGDQHGKVKL